MRDSIIFYRSFYEAIKELPLEMQGTIYSAIFEYSLNFNEIVLHGLPKAIFTLIKPQLDANNKRYENGKKGGRKPNEETVDEPKDNQNETKTEPNKNVNVNANYNAKENEVMLISSLMSEIKISDDKNFFLFQNEKLKTDAVTIEHFTIAEKFRNLFIKNLKEKGSPFVHQEKATFKNYVSPIRLMIENKEATIAQLREAYSFLNSVDGEFWKSNILSTTALRKQISTLIAKKNMVKQPLKPKIEVPDHRKRNKI